MGTLVITDRQQMDEIISKCKVCYIGLADTDGIPYVLPMNFGYDGNTIFLHSGQEGSNIDILKRNNHICVAFSIEHNLVFQHPDVACSYSMRSKSVIAWGKVEYEEDYDKKVEALNIIMKHYSDKKFEFSKPAVLNVKVWKVEIQKITCKIFGVPRK